MPLGARTLLVAPGLTTSNKKATRNYAELSAVSPVALAIGIIPSKDEDISVKNVPEVNYLGGVDPFLEACRTITFSFASTWGSAACGQSRTDGHHLSRNLKPYAHPAGAMWLLQGSR